MLPATTGSGVSVLVMDRSDCRVTEVLLEAESSPVLIRLSLAAIDCTLAVSLMTLLPAAAEWPTVRTSVRVALAPEANGPTVQVPVPLLPEKLPALGVT